MGKQERDAIKATIVEASALASRGHSALAARRAVEEAATEARGLITRSVISLGDGLKPRWRAVPLASGDAGALGAIAHGNVLPAIHASDLNRLGTELTAIEAGVQAASKAVGAGRFFMRKASKEDLNGAIARLEERLADRGFVRTLIDRVEQLPPRPPVSLERAFEQPVGLHAVLGAKADTVDLVPAGAIRGLRESVRALGALVEQEQAARAAALAAGKRIRDEEAARLLAEMPVERLKEATNDRLSFAPLTDVGITTVKDVLDKEQILESIPRIGHTTATRIRGAAHTLRGSTYEETPVRIDIQRRTAAATDLLRALGMWLGVRRAASDPQVIADAAILTPLARNLTDEVQQVVMIGGTAPIAELRAAIERVRSAGPITNSQRGEVDAGGPWDAFMQRPADYFALLSELGLVTEDEEKSHGDLSQEIVEAVRAFELDATHLKASLRGYQAFAAKFALVQKKVIVGDEMGLGKTVEALAVIAHTRAKGSHHALVICPAAVVTNWMREIADKTTLTGHRLHGPFRQEAAKAWLRQGGIAVTTFETLKWLRTSGNVTPTLGAVVVDEAHYIKNPKAQRSEYTAAVIRSTERVVLLTGTPMQNHVDEFKVLVGYLRPDLVSGDVPLAPREFRKRVAPAYLRRNQEDVLTELPDLVEVDEHLPMSSQDQRAYEEAVRDGNFMAMRQAAMSSGQQSSKVERLLEIVEESRENGRRVIVFSYFRDVLTQVHRALPQRTTFGPLNGSVPAAKRQQMVDDFSAGPAGSVLLAQTLAGGVGLNIQAASVIVICEPQLKPTDEWQAIARARRMGQLQSVQVHRLLSEVGVDQRVTEILAAKSAHFAQYAKISATAQSAPEAFDLTEAELARQVIDEERKRLFAMPGKAGN